MTILIKMVESAILVVVGTYGWKNPYFVREAVAKIVGEEILNKVLKYTGAEFIDQIFTKIIGEAIPVDAKQLVSLIGSVIRKM